MRMRAGPRREQRRLPPSGGGREQRHGGRAGGVQIGEQAIPPHQRDRQARRSELCRRQRNRRFGLARRVGQGDARFAFGVPFGLCRRERSGSWPAREGLRHLLQACERDPCRPPEIALAGAAPGSVIGIPVSPPSCPRFEIDIEAAGCAAEGKGSHRAKPCLPRFFVCRPKAQLDPIPSRQRIEAVIAEPGERVKGCSGHTAFPWVMVFPNAPAFLPTENDTSKRGLCNVAESPGRCISKTVTHRSCV